MGLSDILKDFFSKNCLEYINFSFEEESRGVVCPKCEYAKDHLYLGSDSDMGFGPGMDVYQCGKCEKIFRILD